MVSRGDNGTEYVAGTCRKQNFFDPLSSTSSCRQLPDQDHNLNSHAILQIHTSTMKFTAVVSALLVASAAAFAPASTEVRISLIALTPICFREETPPQYETDQLCRSLFLSPMTRSLLSHSYISLAFVLWQ